MAEEVAGREDESISQVIAYEGAIGIADIGPVRRFVSRELVGAAPALLVSRHVWAPRRPRACCPVGKRSAHRESSGGH